MVDETLAIEEFDHDHERAKIILRDAANEYNSGGMRPADYLRARMIVAIENLTDVLADNGSRAARWDRKPS